HERSGNAATTQKIGAKKWPLRRAAKFREETPRKGGGLAIEDRDTALQQYAEVPTCLQDTKYNSSRQNAAERLEKTVTIARFVILLLPSAPLVHCKQYTEKDAADSSHRRNRATKWSRGSAISR
ncbi:MAG TPA: hypothetical protein VEM35_00225, partial [Rhizomicrobium sp.]|nr:hypothetical protein [Rhizomicrobium sp.]